MEGQQLPYTRQIGNLRAGGSGQVMGAFSLFPVFEHECRLAKKAVRATCQFDQFPPVGTTVGKIRGIDKFFTRADQQHLLL